MTTDPPEPADASETPGEYLARVFREQLSQLDRLTATRDVAHEMILAGAEQDLAPGLLADERPEPFTDADLAAADPGEDVAPGDPGPGAATAGPARS